MGYTSYSVSSRSLRAESSGYSKAFTHTDAVFQQNAVGKIHDEMSPKGLKVRECRDSEAHPLTTPVIIALDVTGSMGSVPKDFILSGLPTMMTTILNSGTKDAAVCFMAIGDHVYDRAPIQVGQFESGDAELDMWLTRCYLEGGGGGNDGESYLLAWYTAAYHTVTDSCEKRGKKGLLFTVGDEPPLLSIAKSAIIHLFGEDEKLQVDSLSAESILEKVKECYEVFHIALGQRGKETWTKLLGQHYLEVAHYKEIPELIGKITAEYSQGVAVQEIQVSTPALTLGAL